jgi:signal peptidase I
MIEKMTKDTTGSTFWKDVLNIGVFIVLVAVGVMIINAFIFRSFNVEGPSMEKTLYTGDKLIVNKIPVTIDHLQRKTYIPPRGQVIVFKNPLYESMRADEYIVKRVIGLPGDKVIVRDGNITVFNTSHPNGFNPDTKTHDTEGSPTAGDFEGTVGKNELFVSGDHRQKVPGSGENGRSTQYYSLDSRNGLGMLPLKDVVGPVGIRIFPFQNIRTF